MSLRITSSQKSRSLLRTRLDLNEDIERQLQLRRKAEVRVRVGATVVRSTWGAATGLQALAKRVSDILVASIALILLLPLFFVLAILISSSDGGPALFWQTRLGRGGRPFHCPKFRSMVINAEALKDAISERVEITGGRTGDSRTDPRITRIGRIIRRSRIDELPQFWCVLKGEMTVVGPRPPLPRKRKT